MVSSISRASINFSALTPSKPPAFQHFNHYNYHWLIRNYSTWEIWGSQKSNLSSTILLHHYLYTLRHTAGPNVPPQYPRPETRAISYLVQCGVRGSEPENWSSVILWRHSTVKFSRQCLYGLAQVLVAFTSDHASRYSQPSASPSTTFASPEVLMRIRSIQRKNRARGSYASSCRPYGINSKLTERHGRKW